VARLSAATSIKGLDDIGKLLEGATSVPSGVDERLNEAEREHIRLRASDPALERKRYTDTAVRREAVANHLRALDGSLGATAMDRLTTLALTTKELRAAATIASASDFGSEPIPGVGTSSWRTLWEAARAFSEAEVYRDRAFPAVDEDDACVLCHQQLDETARGRLAQFEAFIRDDTSRRAEVAENELRQPTADALVRRPATSQVEAALQILDDVSDPAVADARTALTAFTDRRTSLETWDPSFDDKDWGQTPSLAVAETLLEQANQERASAAGIDDGGFAASLDQAAREHEELQATVAFLAEYNNIVAELARRRVGCPAFLGQWI